MAEKEIIKLQFAELDPKTEPDPKNPGQTRERKQSPTVEISNGDYSRTFDVKDQPFEMKGIVRKDVDDQDKETGTETVVMTPEEESAMLLRTGHFVPAKGAKEKAPKQVTGKIGGSPPPPPPEESRPSS